MFSELDALVTRIKLFQGRLLRGESNTRVFGAVFFRLAPPAYHQLVYWVEHLVHEVAHLRLELLRVHDPLVLNGLNAEYRAPFRADPRPMLGVYHATFVVARMLRVVGRLAEVESHPIYRERVASLEEKFAIGMDTLRTHGRFSRLGTQILDSMGATAGV